MSLTVSAAPCGWESLASTFTLTLLPAHTVAASALAVGVRFGLVTVKLQVEVLLDASLAVSVTVTFAPGAMAVPAAGLWVTMMPATAVQLSDTVALVV